jgi:hypothetical protein
VDGAIRGATISAAIRGAPISAAARWRSTISSRCRLRRENAPRTRRRRLQDTAAAAGAAAAAATATGPATTAATAAATAARTRSEEVTVILQVGRYSSITDADGVSVRGIARRNMTDGRLRRVRWIACTRV